MCVGNCSAPGSPTKKGLVLNYVVCGAPDKYQNTDWLKSYLVTILINGKKITMEVNMGATVTVMNEET